MKYKIASILLCLLPLFVSGQGLKIKKGVIYVDKEAVAKIAGYSSPFKGVSLDLSDLNDHPMFKLKHVRFDTKNPFLDRMNWQELELLSTGEKVRYAFDKPNYGEKKIMEKLVIKTTSAIFNGDLSVARQNDESDQILQDSMAIAEVQQRIAEGLADDQIERDITMEIEHESVAFKPSRVIDVGRAIYQKVSEHLLFQGAVEIGKITKEAKEEESTLSQGGRYIVYKKVSSSFELNGNASKYIPAAVLIFKNADDILAFMTTFQDQKKHDVKDRIKMGPVNLAYAEQRLVTYLVDEGYL